MPGPKNEKCERCYYFESAGKKKGQGDCRASLPQFGEKGEGSWPNVKASNWCLGFLVHPIVAEAEAAETVALEAELEDAVPDEE